MDIDKLVRLLRNPHCEICPSQADCESYEGIGCLHKEAAAALEYLQQELVNLNKSSSEEKQACFRLGQMDMRESAAAALRKASEGTHGQICATLLATAQLAEEMEVLT